MRDSSIMGRIPAKALQGKHATAVLAKYEAYLKDPSVAEQRHPLKNRPKTKTLYILPFALTLPAKVLVKCSAFEEVFTKYKGDIDTGGTRVKDTLAAGEVGYKFEGYSPPRISIRTGRAGTATKQISKTSGLSYGYYGGSSRSIPFGAKDNTEEVKTVFDTIKTKVADTTGGNPLVTLVAEKVSSK